MDQFLKPAKEADPRVGMPANALPTAGTLPVTGPAADPLARMTSMAPPRLGPTPAGTRFLRAV